MSRIDIYSKFISKQTQSGEHSSIARNKINESGFTADKAPTQQLNPADKDKKKDSKVGENQAANPSEKGNTGPGAGEKMQADAEANKSMLDKAKDIGSSIYHKGMQAIGAEDTPQATNVKPSDADSVAAKNAQRSDPKSTFGTPSTPSAQLRPDQTQGMGGLSTGQGKGTEKVSPGPSTSTSEPAKSGTTPSSSSKDGAKLQTKKKDSSRSQRMDKAMHAGDLQGVVSGTYGEETELDLIDQIIEKYACMSKAKKKVDKTDK